MEEVRGYLLFFVPVDFQQNRMHRTQGSAGGGPGYATTTLISLLYDSGFVDFKMGKASAIAVVIFIILSILTFIQNKVAEDD